MSARHKAYFSEGSQRIFGMMVPPLLVLSTWLRDITYSTKNARQRNSNQVHEVLHVCICYSTLFWAHVSHFFFLQSVSCPDMTSWKWQTSVLHVGPFWVRFYKFTWNLPQQSDKRGASINGDQAYSGKESMDFNAQIRSVRFPQDVIRLFLGFPATLAY